MARLLGNGSLLCLTLRHRAMYAAERATAPDLAVRDPAAPDPAAAAAGHDATARAAHRRTIASRRIVRSSGAAVAEGTNRNARAAA